MGGADAYTKALRQPPDDARVRTALIESGAEIYKGIAMRGDSVPARLIDDLRQLARRDASYGVRAAAITQLGRIGGRRAEAGDH